MFQEKQIMYFKNDKISKKNLVMNIYNNKKNKQIKTQFTS